jgi:hypothetical protein
LKSGKKIEGKVLERTNDSVKIDEGQGVGITYYKEDVSTIDGVPFEVVRTQSVSNEEMAPGKTVIYTFKNGEKEIARQEVQVLEDSSVKILNQTGEIPDGRVVVYTNGKLSAHYTYEHNDLIGGVEIVPPEESESRRRRPEESVQQQLEMVKPENLEKTLGAFVDFLKQKNGPVVTQEVQDRFLQEAHTMAKVYYEAKEYSNENERFYVLALGLGQLAQKYSADLCKASPDQCTDPQALAEIGYSIKTELRNLSIAAESYAVAHNHQFPTNISQLTDSNPPYLKENHCGQTFTGHVFTCTFKSDGYIITATAKNGFYSISTGGVLEP